MVSQEGIKPKLEIRDGDDSEMDEEGCSASYAQMFSDEKVTFSDQTNRPRFRISDRTLAQLSVRELNWVMRKQPTDVIQMVKERRRLLKNRSYAQNTRYQRFENRELLEAEKRHLSGEVQQLKRNNRLLSDKLQQIQAKKANILKVIAQKKKAKEFSEL